MKGRPVRDGDPGGAARQVHDVHASMKGRPVRDGDWVWILAVMTWDDPGVCEP